MVAKNSTNVNKAPNSAKSMSPIDRLMLAASSGVCHLV